MELHAQKYIKEEFVPMGIHLQWSQENDRKKIGFKPMWPRATLKTYKDYFSREDNGIALLTGEPSDLVVIDCDVQKDSDRENGIQDGIALFANLVEQHGLPENTPIQRSPSGGLHYFFSLSKSMEHGLLKASSTTKLKIENNPSSIDTRADGGCIIVSPSEINGRQYTWLSPLVNKSSLPPMPQWCIILLNSNHTSQQSLVAKKDSFPELCSRMSALGLETSTEQRVTVLINDVERTVVKELGTRIETKWMRTQGFDFRPLTRVECTLCGKTHRSNNYMLRQIFEECFYMRNYSKSCSTHAFNWTTQECIKAVLETPVSDKPYALLFNASLRSNGFMITNAYNTKTKQGQFLAFNGVIWQELSEPRVLNDISYTCGWILETLLKHIRPKRDAKEKEIKNIAKQRKLLAAGLAFIRKSSNLKAIMAHYRIMYSDEDLESRLNQNPDILPVRNGVIDLQTGHLRDGAISDYMSRQLDVLYNGLEANTDIIDEFIGCLFNNNQDSIMYLQRLLGYGITGHITSQVWCMFTGKGSNGKSLLASLLEDLLEDWVVTAPYEIFFRGEQRAREGSHSTHLGTLKGARIAIKEEAEPKDKLNTETLKTVTGGGSITMRGAFAREFETYKPMCLPILLCNHRPEVDTTDEAMMRRIVVVPFNNIYTTPDDPKRPFNDANPAHRLRDPELKYKLLKQNAREQFLVWLVRGAVAWYKNKDLSQQPPAMLRAFQEYNNENDKLQQFIHNNCEIGDSHQVSVSLFRDEYCRTMHTNIMQNKLAELMTEKGFKQFSPRKNGKQERTYLGLRLGSSSAFSPL
ncbi:hypothetical protein BGZ46_001883 [Entomortierella lignicola]|nr:hypothetical protein BGZ46_001883 [Entomortierella lignicola]